MNHHGLVLDLNCLKINMLLYFNEVIYMHLYRYVILVRKKINKLFNKNLKLDSVMDIEDFGNKFMFKSGKPGYSMGQGAVRSHAARGAEVRSAVLRGHGRQIVE